MTPPPKPSSPESMPQGLVTSPSGEKPYKAVVHVAGRECRVQGREFRKNEAASLERCDALTAAADACGAYFMWSMTHPSWTCRCCKTFGEIGGKVESGWNVYEVQGNVPSIRRSPPLPPLVSRLTMPLYARAQRCQDQVANLGKAETVAACERLVLAKPGCGPYFMFSFKHPSWGCRCCTKLGPAKGPATLLDWDIYSVQPEGTSLPSPRLYMVAPTSKSSTSRAMKVERSMRKRMESGDRLVHVCGKECAPLARNVLADVLEMPETATSSLRILPECDVPAWAWVCDHRMGAMKFVYGLVHEVRRLKASGYPMPRWWLVKDDDTYVHVPNLMRALDKTRDGKPLWQLPVSFARFGQGCPGACGGAGWVLSGPFAEQLVGQHGDRYLDFAAERIANHWGHYDIYIPEVGRWLKKPVEDMLEMNDYSPVDNGYIRDTVMKEGHKCHVLPYCNCSRTAFPATWHVKTSFEKAVAMLDAAP